LQSQVSVSNFTLKLLIESSWKFCKRCTYICGQGRTD